MHPRLMLALYLLAVSASLMAQSDTSSQPQAANPNTTPTQTSEPSKPQGVPPSASGSTPASGDSAKIVAIKIEKAKYPPQALRDGIQGQVWLKLSVSEAGDVESVEVISGDKILAEAAVAAAKKWKFNPLIKDGKPVKVVTKIPFDFAFSNQVDDTNKDTELPTNAGTGNSADTKQVRISQLVSQGLLIHKVQPIYPEAARLNRIQGTVLMRAVIGKDGRITELTPISGPKELIPAAVGAVQQWRYKPYILLGQPVTVNTQITVNFQLR